MITRDELDLQIKSNKVIPLKDVVIVLRKLASDTTKSGVIKGDKLTQEESKASTSIYVIAKHPDNLHEYSLGDLVKLERYASTNLDCILPGYELSIVRTSMIYGWEKFESISK